jgi:hypothetical protein
MFTSPNEKKYLPIWGMLYGYGNTIMEAKEQLQKNLPDGFDVNDLLFVGNHATLLL